MRPFTTKMKRPRVRIISGAVSSSKTGRRNAFKIPRSNAAPINEPALSYRIPLMNDAATMTATVVIAHLKTKYFIPKSLAVETGFSLASAASCG